MGFYGFCIGALLVFFVLFAFFYCVFVLKAMSQEYRAYKPKIYLTLPVVFFSQKKTCQAFFDVFIKLFFDGASSYQKITNGIHLKATIYSL
jgi:hypothetical protein